MTMPRNWLVASRGVADPADVERAQKPRHPRLARDGIYPHLAELRAVECIENFMSSIGIGVFGVPTLQPRLLVIDA